MQPSGIRNGSNELQGHAIVVAGELRVTFASRERQLDDPEYIPQVAPVDLG